MIAGATPSPLAHTVHFNSQQIVRHLAAGGLAIAVVAMGLVAAVAAVVGWRRLLKVLWLRRWLAARARHYELLPRGERVGDLATAAKSMAEVVGTLRDQRRFPRARLSVHRWFTGGTVHVGITIAGARSEHAADQIARAIGRAVGAEPAALEHSPLPATPTVAYGTRVSFNAVANIAEVLQTTNALDRLAVEGGHRLLDIDRPAFLSVAVEPVADRERNALTAWLASRLKDMDALSGSAQHPWLAAKILTRGMVIAGGPDIEAVKTLVGLARLLPDYDSQLRAHTVSDVDPVGYYAAGTLIYGVILGALAVVAHKPAGIPIAAAVAAASLAVLVVAATGLAGVARRTMGLWLSAGLGPVPPRPLLSWRHGLHGGAQLSGLESDGSKVEWHPYRMVRRALVLAPSHLAAAVAFPPAADVSTTATDASARPAPSAVREAVGARLGYDPGGYGCQVPDTTRSGIFCAGDPGQGKSTLLLSVWASDLLARSAEAAGGELRRCLLWFETKGEGAARALGTAGRCGYDPNSLVFLDVTADQGPQLSLVDHNQPQRSAELLAEAMRYAFPDREILAESEDTLRVLFALALAIPPDVLVDAGEPAAQGFMATAFKLAWGDTSTEAHKRIQEAVDRHLRAATPTADPDNPLAAATVDAGDGLGSSVLADCYRAYATKLRTRAADNESMFSAPRNKIGKLLPAAGLWQPNPARPQVTLEMLLSGRMAAVVNFGGSGGFPDELRSRLGAITVYCLWHAIKTVCDDWDRRGWSTTVFSDEVADIAGTGNPGVPDIIRLMHDHGRSRGVRLVLATQRLAQLPEATAGAVLSFPTKIYLRQEAAQVAEEAIADLGDDCGFTASDIRRLRPMAGIVRMRVGDLVQPPFTLTIAPEAAVDPAQLASPTRTRTVVDAA